MQRSQLLCLMTLLTVPAYTLPAFTMPKFGLQAVRQLNMEQLKDVLQKDYNDFKNVTGAEWLRSTIYGATLFGLGIGAIELTSRVIIPSLKKMSIFGPKKAVAGKQDSWATYADIMAKYTTELGFLEKGNAPEAESSVRAYLCSRFKENSDAVYLSKTQIDRDIQSLRALSYDGQDYAKSCLFWKINLASIAALEFIKKQMNMFILDFFKEEIALMENQEKVEGSQKNKALLDNLDHIITQRYPSYILYPYTTYDKALRRAVSFCYDEEYGAYDAARGYKPYIGTKWHSDAHKKLSAHLNKIHDLLVKTTAYRSEKRDPNHK